MPNLPSNTLTATNGNLGILNPSAAQTVLICGVCSAGIINDIVQVDTKQALINQFGTGPMVDAAALALDQPGRGAVLCQRINGSVAGANGPVTKTDPTAAVGTPTTFGGVNGVTLTAKIAGVTFTVVVAGMGTALSVPALGPGVKAIVVNSATDLGGAATSTGDLIRAALLAQPTVAALIAAANAGTGADVVGAVAVTPLPFGSTGAMSIAGVPLDAYQVRVKFTRAGALGTAAFRYSLDGGDVYSDEIATPGGGVYVIVGTGLTVTFTGSFSIDDLFSVDCTAPNYTTGDLAAALTVAQSDRRRFGLVHVIGQIVRATLPTLFASVATFANAFELVGKYCRFVLQAASNEGGETNAQWSAAWITAMANSVHARIMIFIGDCEVVAPLLTPQAARTMRRSVAVPAMALLATLRPGKDLGDQTIPALLPGVSKLYHLDQADTLAGQRFSVAYTVTGIDGYLAEGRLFDQALPPGDFKYIQYGRVIDVAMDVAWTYMNRFMNAGPRVRKKAQGAYPAGSIDPSDAGAMDQAGTALLREALGVKTGDSAPIGDATDAELLVDRTTNLISTNTLPYNVQVTPLGYLKTLTGKAGLVNPRLRV